MSDAEETVRHYEELIDGLLGVHREQPKFNIDWAAEAELPNPSRPIPTQSLPLPPPIPSDSHEQEAVLDLEMYNPGFFERLFGRAKTRRREFLENIEVAKERDRERWSKVQIEHEAACKAAQDRDRESLTKAQLDHERALSEMEARRVRARRILEGELLAYSEVVLSLNPFKSIGWLGPSLEIAYESPTRLRVTIQSLALTSLPKVKFSLTQNGRLSQKDMTKTEMYALQQDYICGVALRAAREFFGLLPLDEVRCNIEVEQTDSSTGHKKMERVLSVDLDRTTMQGLNLADVDASDSMANFPHNMTFKKTKGLMPVEPLNGWPEVEP